MTKPASPAHAGTSQPVIATEVVLPGLVEPAGLQLRHRPLPPPGSGQALVRVGTAAAHHHPALRDLGVTPVDYNDPDLVTRVRDLAPGGVDAVFDHLGLASARASFRLLNRGGTLVAYGTAARLNDTNAMIPMFLGLLARIYAWNLMPNHRRAAFYNFWAGHTITPRRFRRRQHHDLGAVLSLLASGVITAQVAARFPLTQASAAMELAESRTVRGKVILQP